MAVVAAMGDGSDDVMIVCRHPADMVDTAELGRNPAGILVALSERCRYLVALSPHLCSDLALFWCDLAQCVTSVSGSFRRAHGGLEVAKRFPGPDLLEAPGSFRELPGSYPEFPGNSRELPDPLGSSRKFPEASRKLPGNSQEFSD